MKPKAQMIAAIAALCLGSIALLDAQGIGYWKAGGGAVSFDDEPVRASSAANSNVFIGPDAGNPLHNETGTNNLIFGYQAGASLTSASDVVAIGRSAYSFGTTMSDTIAIGTQAGYAGGGGNTWIGVEAGRNCGAACTENVGIGKQVLYNMVASNKNVAIGRTALFDVTTANGSDTWNTAIGYGAGRGVTTGTRNTFVGSQCNVGDVTGNVVLCDGDGNARFRYNGTNWVMGAGGLQYTTAAEPACNAGNRGMTWYVAGGAGVADTYRICRKDAGDAYAWVTLF